MYKALTALILFVSFPVFAETAISHIVVNQRWPWSEKVDVDFILSGGDAPEDHLRRLVLGGPAARWRLSHELVAAIHEIDDDVIVR